MQLDLGFLKTPHPVPNMWEALDDEQRLALLDVPVRLIVQAARPEPNTEEHDDE